MRSARSYCHSYVYRYRKGLLVVKACTLDAYLFEVRSKGARKKTAASRNLDQFDGANSFKAFVGDLFSDYKSYVKHDVEQRSYRITNIEQSGDCLSAAVSMGEFGLESEITDINTGNVNYKKKKNDIDPVSYVVVIRHEFNARRGVLCVQRSGVSGVSGFVKNLLSIGFSKLFPDYRLQISNIMPAELARAALEEGAMRELVFQRFEIPSDLADRVGGDARPYEGTVELRIKPKGNGLFRDGAVLALLDPRSDHAGIASAIGGAPQSIKTIVDLNGRERVLNLTKPDHFHASFDISGVVVEGRDGAPTLQSVVDEASRIAGDLIATGNLR